MSQELHLIYALSFFFFFKVNKGSETFSGLSFPRFLQAPIHSNKTLNMTSIPLPHHHSSSCVCSTGSEALRGPEGGRGPVKGLLWAASGPRVGVWRPLFWREMHHWVDLLVLEDTVLYDVY